jgi:hypothetical protein
LTERLLRPEELCREVFLEHHAARLRSALRGSPATNGSSNRLEELGVGRGGRRAQRRSPLEIITFRPMPTAPRDLFDGREILLQIFGARRTADADRPSYGTGALERLGSS